MSKNEQVMMNKKIKKPYKLRIREKIKIIHRSILVNLNECDELFEILHYHA